MVLGCVAQHMHGHHQSVITPLLVLFWNKVICTELLRFLFPPDFPLTEFSSFSHCTNFHIFHLKPSFTPDLRNIFTKVWTKLKLNKAISKKFFLTSGNLTSEGDKENLAECLDWANKCCLIWWPRWQWRWWWWWWRKCFTCFL